MLDKGKFACIHSNSLFFVHNLWITALVSRRDRQKSRIAANCPNSLRTKFRIFYYLDSFSLIDGGPQQIQIDALAREPNLARKKLAHQPMLRQTYARIFAGPSHQAYNCAGIATLTPETTDGTKLKQFIWRISLAVHTSVIKRHQQSLTRRARNIEIRSKLRTLLKKTRQAIESKNSATTVSQLREVNKALGKAVSKGIIKSNTASRWLSRLSRSASKATATS